MDLHKEWLVNFLQRVGQGWRTDGGKAEHQEIPDSGELPVALLGLEGQGKRMFFAAPEQARAVEVGSPDRSCRQNHWQNHSREKVGRVSTGTSSSAHPSFYCQSLLLAKPNQIAAG